MRLTSDHPGAFAQEHGGTLHFSDLAAVPIGHPGLQGPRADGDLVAFRARSGRLFLGQRNGRSLRPRWELVNEIRIRGHHFMKQGGSAALLHLRKHTPQLLRDAAHGR